MVSPVRLDPFQRIVNVGWRSGGPDIGVLIFSIEFGARDSTYSDNPTLSGLPFSGGPFSVFATLRVPSDVEFNLPNLPADMLSRGLLASPPKYEDTEATAGEQTFTVVDQATLFFRPEGGVGFPYSGVFTVSTVDGLSIAGGPFGSIGDAAAEYFTNQYNPMGGGGGPGLGPGTLFSYFDATGGGEDPHLITHEETINWTDYETEARAIVFFNLARIKALHGNVFQFDINIGGSPLDEFYSWTAALYTFRGHSEFPISAQNTPLFPFLPQSATSQSAMNGGESILPAYTAHFTVDLTTLDAFSSKETA